MKDRCSNLAKTAKSKLSSHFEREWINDGGSRSNAIEQVVENADVEGAALVRQEAGAVSMSAPSSKVQIPALHLPHKSFPRTMSEDLPTSRTLNHLLNPF